jgi:hypothetical protein
MPDQGPTQPSGEIFSYPLQDDTCNGYACLCQIGLECIDCGNKDRRTGGTDGGGDGDDNDVYACVQHTLAYTPHFESLAKTCWCKTQPQKEWNSRLARAKLYKEPIPEQLRRRCTERNGVCMCAAMYRYGMCRCCWHSNKNRIRVYYPYTQSAIRKQFPVQRDATITLIAEWHMRALEIFSSVSVRLIPPPLHSLISQYLEVRQPPNFIGESWSKRIAQNPSDFTERGVYSCNKDWLRSYLANKKRLAAELLVSQKLEADRMAASIHEQQQDVVIWDETKAWDLLGM